MSTTSLHLAPGSGLLARRSTALLYAAGRDTALVDVFTASPIGAELQALASATVAAGFEVGPFVGLSWEHGLRVMAFGDVAVETDQPSLPMLSGAGSRTWVEHTVATSGDAVVEVAGAETHTATDLADGIVFAGGFRLELRASADVEAAPAPAPAAPARDETIAIPRHDPDASVPTPTPEVAPPDRSDAAPLPVPAPRPPSDVDADDPVAALAAIQAAAIGVDGEPIEPAGAPVETVAAPATPVATEGSGSRLPDSEPPDAEPPDADITLPPPASEALLADVRAADATHGRGSLVDAKRCGNGHANPPTAATCGVCGEFLAPGTRSVVHIPRPSLGRLQLDDGDIVGLDQELLIGRNPDRDADVARAGLRRVKTVGEKVSRSHLEVRFQGWDVLVADCGSTNGTFVVPHPGGQVAALEPGRPQLVEPGAVVYFGSRSFTVLGRDEA